MSDARASHPVAADARAWPIRVLDVACRRALERQLKPTELWSTLLSVVQQRSRARAPADLMRQWQRDRFVKPCPIDQRVLRRLELQLLEAARGFEAVELSPLAPLGTCSVVTPGSQERIVSTVRGTEVVADPTNVMALMCAERLRTQPAAEVRLATVHRCVRAQRFPDKPGFSANFSLFCLASAARERADHAFLVDALAEHAAVHLGALENIHSQLGTFPALLVRLLSTSARRHVADRLQGRLRQRWPSLEVEHDTLESAYYDGIRFMIDTRAESDERLPIADGGAFDWVQRLASNDRLTFVASGLGTQLLATALQAA